MLATRMDLPTLLMINRTSFSSIPSSGCNCFFVNSSIACSLGIDERVRNETAVPVLPALFHQLTSSRLPGGSSDTMNVIKRRLRQVEVDNQVHLRDIETTGRHVGAHEHGALRVAELADGGAATTLVQHGVETDVVHLEDTEQLGKKLRRPTGVAEHDSGGLVHDSLFVLLLTLHYNPMRHSVLLLWTMKYTK